MYSVDCGGTEIISNLLSMRNWIIQILMLSDPPADQLMLINRISRMVRNPYFLVAFFLWVMFFVFGHRFLGVSSGFPNLAAGCQCLRASVLFLFRLTLPTKTCHRNIPWTCASTGCCVLNYTWMRRRRKRSRRRRRRWKERRKRPEDAFGSLELRDKSALWDRCVVTVGRGQSSWSTIKASCAKERCSSETAAVLGIIEPGIGSSATRATETTAATSTNSASPAACIRTK